MTVAGAATRITLVHHITAGLILAGLATPIIRSASAAALSREDAFRRVETLSNLGARLFRDPRLSASGRQSCASCHDPAHGFAPPDARAVEPGGDAMTRFSFRAPPSLTYLAAVPRFTEHAFDSEDEADESIDNGPTGGLTWDGRVDTGAAQSLIPLLSPDEMANQTPQDAEARLVGAGYGPELDALRLPIRSGALQSRLSVAQDAFEAYEQDWKTFYPFNSKYDLYLAGKARLSPAETRGLAAFEDPAKGNCASCHISEPRKDGAPPLFSDFGMIALAVPRNRAIPANRDPQFHDLGLCGPLRKDFLDRSEYCGLFRTPSLRNVALRSSFFHNGVMHNLRDAIAFYATRDTDPAHWYPHGPRGIRPYDDLPRRYWININDDPPFGGKPGDAPHLTDADVDDIAAFLRTLTDNWKPDDQTDRSAR
ncbi:cytochrome-c peroxidase [Acetobacter sp. DsW_063]|uniref:cytochrome-c peroxidase n=1 Tax=Acetobacter sp. DsW_063 TaxID=1514894 RepID=UPI001E51C4D3|nr:cytochrome c peroxidase [Acetobacter sp. DsW_063]